MNNLKECGRRAGERRYSREELLAAFELKREEFNKEVAENIERLRAEGRLPSRRRGDGERSFGARFSKGGGEGKDPVGSHNNLENSFGSGRDFSTANAELPLGESLGKTVDGSAEARCGEGLPGKETHILRCGEGLAAKVSLTEAVTSSKASLAEGEGPPKAVEEVTLPQSHSARKLPRGESPGKAVDGSAERRGDLHASPAPRADERRFYISDFMTGKLMLKGPTLVVYAIMYSFTKGGEGEFYGSRNMIAASCGISLATVVRSLKELEDCGLIIKLGVTGGIKSTVRYKVTAELAEMKK